MPNESTVAFLGNPATETSGLADNDQARGLECIVAFPLNREPSRAREARALLPLLEDGGTVEEIRELIAVPPTIDRALRGFAWAIQTVLSYAGGALL